MQTLSPSQERRISIRTNLLGVSAKVSKDGWKWEEIVVNDISDGGIGFEMQTEYPVGEKLIMQGEASDFARAMDISCDVRIVFAGTTADGNFLYGARFTNMSKAQTTGLSVFIELMVTKYPSLLLQ
ncbi:MAG: PilZ domain-containing protein [Defluviitaleaceae bacterium]|nr:PilZ domain-containing protein [Defluviitaleaceae bacterium]